MSAERCPNCQGTNLRRSSRPLQNILRLLTGDPKRFCRDCGKRFLRAAER